MDIQEAAKVLRAWADDNIISDNCIPAENREDGCLSCKTLAFFEALDTEIADMNLTAGKRLVIAAKEALAIARGEAEPARVHYRSISAGAIQLPD